MSFLEFILFVKGKLGTYPSEEAVKINIILPVLQHLGWNTGDYRYVYPEYPLSDRKVDYGLKVSEEENKAPQCIIEAKAEGKLGATDRQLFQCAFIAGVRMAVLTDGRLWRFYLPMTLGSFEERLIRTLDIRKDKSQKIIEVLNRYLSYKNMCSGETVSYADCDQDEWVRENGQSKKSIAVAWKNLLYGSSDNLITLLIEEASQISSGCAPIKEDVETFLRNLDNVDLKSKDSPKVRKRGGKSFSLFSKNYSDYPNVASAFAKILEILAKRNKRFLARLASETAGSKYPLLSKSRKDLAPNGRGYARKLPGDWWLCVYSSTAGKIEKLKKACEVAGIPFGKSSGLKVNF